MTTPTEIFAPKVLPRSAGGVRSEARRRQVLVRRLELIATFSPGVECAQVAVAALVAWILFTEVSGPATLGFLAAAVAAAAAQALLLARCRKAAPPAETATHWSRAVTLAALIGGCVWGAAGFYLFVPDAPEHQAVLALAIFGVVSMSVASSAPYMPAFLAFALPSTIPLSLRFLLGGDTLQPGLGALALLFLVLLIGGGSALGRRLVESLELRIDNGELIENLLAAQERRNIILDSLETALESMSEALAVFDADDRLVICNSRFMGEQKAGPPKILPGITFEELVRRDIGRAGVVNAIGREEEYVAERLAYHHKLEGIFEIELVDGRWLRVRDRRTHDGGTVIVQTEITAYKHAELQLRAEKERAEQANRAKSEFLANTSHEFRTPLNAIIGFSEIMKEEILGPLGDRRYSGYAKDIHESGLHLLAVINDILDLAKIESGKLELCEEIIDVGHAVESACNVVMAQAPGGRPVFNADIPASLPGLRADRRMVQQILLNLLSNAFKFTPVGGHIEVTAELNPCGELVIRVNDTGIGMSKDDLELAFEPFARGQGPLVRNHEGTGLGLSLSKSLLELHGGVLEIESAPGQGTRVTARFPTRRVVKMDQETRLSGTSG